MARTGYGHQHVCSLRVLDHRRTLSPRLVHVVLHIYYSLPLNSLVLLSCRMAQGLTLGLS